MQVGVPYIVPSPVAPSPLTWAPIPQTLGFRGLEYSGCRVSGFVGFRVQGFRD